MRRCRLLWQRKRLAGDFNFPVHTRLITTQCLCGNLCNALKHFIPWETKTGSVNQLGEIQPVGGINQKIEGFYYTCRTQGLTGAQGVLIPEQNRKDVMLRDEVLEAVRKKKFHIYAISTIDEGLEILTGKKAGRRTKAGFEEGSIHGRVDGTLREFARRWQELGGGR